MEFIESVLGGAAMFMLGTCFGAHITRITLRRKFNKVEHAAIEGRALYQQLLEREATADALVRKTINERHRLALLANQLGQRIVIDGEEL